MPTALLFLYGLLCRIMLQYSRKSSVLGVLNEMVFSSLLFLFYFLAPVLCIYVLVPNRYKNLTLFIASLFFYAWGEPTYVLLMIFSAAFNYLSAFVIAKSKSKAALSANCIVNLGLLVVFKYSDFFISTVNGRQNQGAKRLCLVRTLPFIFPSAHCRSHSEI